MINRSWPLLLALLLLLDLAYSFRQHYQAPIQGDLAAIVLPSDWYRQVLTDPLGLHALRGEVYAAPNRYFQHQTIVQYFRAVPLALQRWVSPISSIYAACALAKTLVQALLIYLLGGYISGQWAVWNRRWLLAAALVTPLFQANGWNRQLGIIDYSVVYALCYALPLALLLLFARPYFRAAVAGQPVRLSVLGWVAGLVLALVLALNSPIVTGVVLLLGPGALLYMGYRAWRARSWAAVRAWPPAALVPLGLLILLSLYSLYIGRLNAENLTHTLPLAERYARLPLGIFYQLTQKLGLPLLLLMLGLNRWLLGRLPDSPERRRLLRVGRWLAVFIVVYVLLLPLGGYRNYRPFILRHDTVLPITLGLLYWYGASAYFLLRQLAPPLRRRYALGLSAFLLIATLSDRPGKGDDVACERAALTTLAAATTPAVALDTNCAVMDWEKYARPEESETTAALLHYWGVTKQKTLFFHR